MLANKFAWSQIQLFKYEHVFLENWQVSYKSGLPLSSTNILCLKGYPHNLTKYEIYGTSKIQISQLFSELGKIWKCNLDLYSEKPSFLLVYDWKKLRSPPRLTFKNPKISLLTEENEEIHPKTITRMNWGNFCPNLSFTVENEVGNLHRIGLLIFQLNLYCNEWDISLALI